jgi:hypothetical protein
MRIQHLAAAFLALLAIAAAPAQAQIFRAYLTLDGSDSNPCTLASPCRLLPAALAAVADGGEIWMLDSANYNTGPVTVSKSVTLLAVPGALGSVVALGGDALVISTTGVVTLRNLNILPFPGNVNQKGVNKNGAGSLTIQDCNIFGFSNGVGVYLVGAVNATVTRTVFRDNALGLAGTDGPIVGISDSLFANHAGYAAYGAANAASSTVRLSVSRSVMRNSGIGVAVDSQGTGTAAHLDLSDSRIEGSGSAGSDGVQVFATAGATALGSVTGSVISGTEFAVKSVGAATTKVFVSGSTITDNTNGLIQLDPAILESAGNNNVRNNTSNTVGTVTNVGTM